MSQNIKKEMRTTLIETLKNVLHTLKDEKCSIKFCLF